jgi:hypothetical protein
VVLLHLAPGRREPRIGLSYRPRTNGPPRVSRADVEAVLGSPTDAGSPLEVISTGLRHLIVPFTQTEDLARLDPSERSLTELGMDCHVHTVCAFAPLGKGGVRMGGCSHRSAGRTGERNDVRGTGQPPSKQPKRPSIDHSHRRRARCRDGAAEPHRGSHRGRRAKSTRSRVGIGLEDCDGGGSSEVALSVAECPWA